MRQACSGDPVSIVQSSAYSEVVDVACQSCRPRQLIGRAQVRAGDLGDLDVVVRVASPDRVGGSGVVEPLECVLADGLQEAVPDLAIVFGHDQ